MRQLDHSPFPGAEVVFAENILFPVQFNGAEKNFFSRCGTGNNSQLPEVFIVENTCDRLADGLRSRADGGAVKDFPGDRLAFRAGTCEQCFRETERAERGIGIALRDGPGIVAETVFHKLLFVRRVPDHGLGKDVFFIAERDVRLEKMSECAPIPDLCHNGEQGGFSRPVCSGQQVNTIARRQFHGQIRDPAQLRDRNCAHVPIPFRIICENYTRARRKLQGGKRKNV